MTVVNGNREVCEAFKKRYGGNICYVKSYGRCRELWRWHLTGARQLYHAVDDMLPHSIVKRDQLVALSIALQSYGHNAGGAGLSLEQRTLRRLGWLKIRHLNADRHNGRRQHEAQHVFDAIREAQVTQGV
jgi:hypothetical protein